MEEKDKLNKKDLEIILKSGRKIIVNKNAVQFHDNSEFKYDSSKSIAKAVKYPKLRWMNDPHMVNYYLGKKDVGPLVIGLDSLPNNKSRTQYIPRSSVESIIEIQYKD
jgi:hypothetical protein